MVLIKFPLLGTQFLTIPAAAVTAIVWCGLLGVCVPVAVSSIGARSSVTPRAPSASPAAKAASASSAAKVPPDAAGRDRAGAQTASRAWLSIPSIGVHALRVVAYTGYADDLPGTRIEDRGVAASPRGRRGGVAPGQMGNLIITAHRTSAGGPLLRLPSLRGGAHIVIGSGGMIYDYLVTRTMTISFRSRASLALQSAAVPGRPHSPATRAMITLSTCATQEDHARGNYWRDALGNPEHRIDKVGVLVAIR